MGHSPLPKPHPTPNGTINIVAGPLFKSLRRLWEQLQMERWRDGEKWRDEEKNMRFCIGFECENGMFTNLT